MPSFTLISPPGMATVTTLRASSTRRTAWLRTPNVGSILRVPGPRSIADGLYGHVGQAVGRLGQRGKDGCGGGRDKLFGSLFMANDEATQELQGHRCR